MVYIYFLRCNLIKANILLLKNKKIIYFSFILLTYNTILKIFKNEIKKMNLTFSIFPINTKSFNYLFFFKNTFKIVV